MGLSRLFKIIMSESTYLIWKLKMGEMRNEEGRLTGVTLGTRDPQSMDTDNELEAKNRQLINKHQGTWKEGH